MEQNSFIDNEQVFELLENLRTELVQVELMTRPPKGGDYMELLLLKREQLKFTIDPNFNHMRPHFHVDYGKKFHALSVCINTSEILAGYVQNKYLKVIIEFTTTYWNRK